MIVVIVVTLRTKVVVVMGRPGVGELRRLTFVLYAWCLFLFQREI